jgi:hypothetical protein
MRVTTALPEDDQRFIAALAEILGRGHDRIGGLGQRGTGAEAPG